ncbi:MAG: hypothetical protein ACKVWV_12785 [Planctomycetota bacterium]
MPTVVGVLVVGTVLALALIAFVREPQTETAGGGEIVIEDVLGFRVANVRTASTLGASGSELRANGRFWIVDLEIKNHGHPSEYRVDSHRPVLVGESFRDRHTIDQRAQDVLRANGGLPAPPPRLAAGETCTQQLVYDVPTSLDRGDLRILWGGPLGELLKDIVLGDKRITLFVPHEG